VKARGMRPHLQARSRIRAPQPRVRLQGQPLRTSLHNHRFARHAPCSRPSTHASLHRISYLGIIEACQATCMLKQWRLLMQRCTCASSACASCCALSLAWEV